MHVVHYEQADGLSGLGRTAGGLLAAQVVDISDGVVHVRPLPGSVAGHGGLLTVEDALDQELHR